VAACECDLFESVCYVSEVLNQEAAQLVVCVLCLLYSADIDIAELCALPVMLF
jgi:hypothetical protein